MRERCLAVQQLVNQHSKGPNICLWAIDILDESLGRHVDRRSNVDVLEFSFGKFGKAKVSQLGLAIVDEDIGNLEVPMHDVIFSEVEEASEDVLDVSFGFWFLDVAAAAEFALEVAFVAEFGDDVAVAIAGENLVAAQDVGMVQLLQDINFGEEKFFKLLALEAVEFDDLDGDDFFCMGRGLLVS